MSGSNELFEAIAKKAGCICISDMRYEPYIQEVKKLLAAMDPQEYSLEALNEIAEYVYETIHDFPSTAQAVEFFRRSMEEAEKSGGGVILWYD